MTEAPLTIVELTASNVKRLRAVSIRPTGELVVLGGRNGAGKSSVLDAITYALAGKDAICDQPVRQGEERAEVIVDLGSIIVRRTWTASGSTNLVVQSAEGARYASPQKMLDELVGRLSFDPLAFLREKPARQAEILREMTGLDTAAFDRERQRVYDQRTEVGRRGKDARARESQFAYHEGVGSEEVSLRDLLRRRDGIVADQAAWDKVASDLDAATRRLDAARQALEKAEDAFAKANARMDAMPEPEDFGPLDQQIAALEETNQKVRENQQRAKFASELRDLGAQYEALTAMLDDIDERKAAMIADARMPIDGLGIDDAGKVTFGGIPLAQASQAEQLRVSIAIGLALNPRLRVMTIRDASLLDSDSLRIVAEMARDAGAQLWLERVEQDSATTVLIEDGSASEVTR